MVLTSTNLSFFETNTIYPQNLIRNLAGYFCKIMIDLLNTGDIKGNRRLNNECCKLPTFFTFLAFNEPVLKSDFKIQSIFELLKRLILLRISSTKNPFIYLN